LGLNAVEGHGEGGGQEGPSFSEKVMNHTIISSIGHTIILNNSSKFFLNLNGAVQEAEHPEANCRSSWQ
jgi:hypothetical protein